MIRNARRWEEESAKEGRGEREWIKNARKDEKCAMAKIGERKRKRENTRRGREYAKR